TAGVDFSRVSFRTNVDANLTDRLTASLRLAPSYSIRHQPASGEEGRGNAFGAPLMINPIVSAYDENGDVIPYPSEEGPEVPGAWTHANPLYVGNNVADERRNFRILTGIDFDYEIIDGLVARSTFNIDYGRERREYFNPSTVGDINEPPPTIPEGSESDGTRLNWLSETTLNFQNDNVGPGRL